MWTGRLRRRAARAAPPPRARYPKGISVAFRPGTNASSAGMMVRARVFCSDPACDAVFEAIGPLEELEALACTCGGGLDITGSPDESKFPPHGHFEVLPLAA